MSSKTRAWIICAGIFLYWIASTVTARYLHDHHIRSSVIVRFVIVVGVSLGFVALLYPSVLILNQRKLPTFAKRSICFSLAMAGVGGTFVYLGGGRPSGFGLLEFCMGCAAFGIFVATIFLVFPASKLPAPDYPFASKGKS